MVTVSDYRLGKHFPAYMVTCGREEAVAIFFSREYAVMYARFLSKELGEELTIDTGRI